MLKKQILIICPYPKGWAAGQRLKYEQYISYWEKNEYEVTISSFFDLNTWSVLYKKNNYAKKYLNRFLTIKQVKKYEEYLMKFCNN